MRREDAPLGAAEIGLPDLSSNQALEVVRGVIRPLLEGHGIDPDSEAWDQVTEIPGLADNLIDAAVAELRRSSKPTNDLAGEGTGRTLRAAGSRERAASVLLRDVARGALGAAQPTSGGPVVLPGVARRRYSVAIERDPETGQTNGYEYPEGVEDYREAGTGSTSSGENCSEWWPIISNCTDSQTTKVEAAREHMRSHCDDIPEFTDAVGRDYRELLFSGRPDLGAAIATIVPPSTIFVGTGAGTGSRDPFVAPYGAAQLRLFCTQLGPDDDVRDFAHYDPDTPFRLNIDNNFFDSFGAAAGSVIVGPTEFRAGVLLHEAAHAVQHQSTEREGLDASGTDALADRDLGCLGGCTASGGVDHFPANFPPDETSAAFIQFRFYGFNECSSGAAACHYGRSHCDEFHENNSRIRLVGETLACNAILATVVLVVTIIAIIIIFASGGTASGLVYEIVIAIIGAAIFTLLFIAFLMVASRAEP